MTNKTKKSAKRGFTLIELMIVVAIIGILAAVAIPKFADLISKSKEGATKGSLGAMRSALAVYYGDQEGWFPVDGGAGATKFLTCLIPKYIKAIAKAKIPRVAGGVSPGHPDKNDVVASTNTPALFDTGGWNYNPVPTSTFWGDIAVNCSHDDSKGRPWTSY